MAKNWKRFTIMNKNRRVASVREDGTCTIYLPGMLPYNICLENISGNRARMCMYDLLGRKKKLQHLD